MLFNEEFVESLSENPVQGVVDVCDKVIASLDRSTQQDYTENDFNVLLEAFSLVQGIFESYMLGTEYVPPNLEGSIVSDAGMLEDYLSRIKQEFQAETSQVKIQSLKARYKTALGAGFYYEFSQGDLERIQKLISELRDTISSSTLLEADHKRRLLKRLERLQSELHKKVSDLDSFWGLVGDAGVALGKLGNDAKPIVDRIREITNIIWRTQLRAEELPSDIPRPLLEDKSDRNGDE